MMQAQSTAEARPSLDALAAIPRETLQDRVFGEMRGHFIHGAFDAGEVFMPGDIAARLGVSSMPVREAIARLVSERALETMANRRARVPLLRLSRGRDIAAARALIEGDLAERACAAITDTTLAELDALTDRYEAETDTCRIARLNYDFHFALYACAGSSVLLPMVESLWMQAGPYVRAAARLHRPLTDPAASKHHRGIISALRKRDAGAIAAELRADIGQSFAILERAGPDWWGGDDER